MSPTSEALPEFDDPRVKVVYDILCDTTLTPPDDKHWEGFVARHIVAILASAPASPAIGIQAVTLDFHAADTTPDVPRGQMKACVIMMRSRHTGKNFTMPAWYLNAYPLEFKDGCGDEKCEDEHDDGCPVTGWFYDNANFEYENCYYRIEGECLAWALIPDAASVEAALHPAPEAASAGGAGEVEAMRLAEEIAEARRRLAAWDINALPNDMSLLDIVDARIGDLQKYMNLVDNLPFRHQDIQRGLILFRTSNNAHGLTNFVSLTARVEALPQSAKDELASMMRNIAEGLSPAAPSDTAPAPKGVSDGVRP